MNHDPIYLSREEAAALLGVTPDTLVKWTRTRGVPCRRYSPRRVVFPRAELHAWLEQQQPGGGATLPPSTEALHQPRRVGAKIVYIAER